jgi:hypothetical protein
LTADAKNKRYREGTRREAAARIPAPPVTLSINVTVSRSAGVRQRATGAKDATVSP